MKKSIFLLGTLAMFATATYAQKKSDAKKTTTTATSTKSTSTTATPTATPTSTGSTVKGQTPPATSTQTATPAPATPAQNPDEHMKFAVEEHNFNTIPEGPAVSFDFDFENIGKEAIVLSSVQASCGCTTPNWSKEAILPGKTSKITATYNTQGRPGAFTKTITVNSNVGMKVLKITGTVEKAPEGSVPQNDNSMMKH